MATPNDEVISKFPKIQTVRLFANPPKQPAAKKTNILFIQTLQFKR